MDEGFTQVEPEAGIKMSRLRNGGSKWVPMIGIRGFSICMAVLCFDGWRSCPAHASPTPPEPQRHIKQQQ